MRSLQVSARRWREAQAFELSTWRRQESAPHRFAGIVRYLVGKRPVAPGDDWNHWWREKFDNYATLPARVSAAIELGCGPYTNIRLILERCHADRIVCSDPLAGEYLKLRHSWLARSAAMGSIEVDRSPIETAPFPSESFDLVVLINVLDHVRDAEASLKTAIRITRRGGHLVVGQDLTSDADAAQVGWDVGHPIRLEHQDLDGLLAAKFEPLFRRILDRADGRNPEAHYGTYLTIGRRH